MRGMTGKQVHYLLITLCDELVYRLDAPAVQRICNSPPPTADRFTDVVLRAEGMDPALQKNERCRVREIVAKPFEKAELSHGREQTPPF